jgi:hypothetical protein
MASQDPFRRVSPGDKVRISSRTWNGILETVEAFQRPYALGVGETVRQPLPPGVLLAKNTTASVIDRYRVVGFSGVTLDGTKKGFLETMAMEARKPTADDHTVFGVTQEMIPANQFGRVMVFGLTYLRVDARHDDDEYAEVVANDHVARSTPVGLIQLLKMTPGDTPPEERWCIARIGHLLTASRFCKPDANIASGATGTVSIWTAGPADGGASDTTRNDSGQAPVAVDAGQWCTIEVLGGDKYVLPFKCSV